MIIINLRQGVGFDIEYNEDICHIIDTGDKNNALHSFNGIIILVPFLKLYIGNFMLIDEMIEPND